MPTLVSLAARVKAEGKDSLGQHSTTINNFIGDVVREICTTFKFDWLFTETTVVTTGTWVSLDASVRAVLGCDIANKKVLPLKEADYFFKKKSVIDGSKAYYRLRYNKTAEVYQINFINIDDGVTVNLLTRNVYSDPTYLPSELEEMIVEGALYKYHRFLEGDDGNTALQYKARYADTVTQYWNFLAMQIVDGEDARVMTNAEIEAERCDYYEDED